MLSWRVTRPNSGLISEKKRQMSHLPFPTASPPLIFDGKYPLTRENSPPILRAVRSNALSINSINYQFNPAHIKASLFGSSKMVLVDDGKLVLGTWQGIFFCEFDGPRSRSLLVKVVTDNR